MPESDRGEGAQDGVGGPQVAPVLGREVVEGEEHVAVLGQAGTGLLVFGAVLLQEVAAGFPGLPVGLRESDLVKVGLGLRLQSLGELVEDVGGLVHHADSVDDSDQLLAAIGRRTHEHEQALLRIGFISEADRDVDAIDPDIHVGRVEDVAAAPFLVFPAPSLLETDDVVQTEPLGRWPDE